MKQTERGTYELGTGRTVSASSSVFGVSLTGSSSPIYVGFDKEAEASGDPEQTLSLTVEERLDVLRDMQSRIATLITRNLLLTYTCPECGAGMESGQGNNVQCQDCNAMYPFPED